MSRFTRLNNYLFRCWLSPRGRLHSVAELLYLPGVNSKEFSGESTLERLAKKTKNASQDRSSKDVEPAYTHPTPMQQPAVKSGDASYIPLQDQSRRGTKEDEKVYEISEQIVLSALPSEGPPLDPAGYVAGF